MKTKPKVSIVCPAYQEEEVLPLFHLALAKVLDRLSEFRFEVIYVDDGSADGTLDCLRSLGEIDRRVNYLSLSRNQGHQIALLAGLQHAHGEVVISLDSDLQHPPELIGELLKHWQKGAQIVQTIRVETEGAGWFKRVTSRAFYWLLEKACGSRLLPGAADFRLLDRVALDGLLQFQEPRPFLRGVVSRLGFRTSLVHYSAKRRAAGCSKYHFGKMLQLALDAFFSYSLSPAQIVVPLVVMTGLICLGLGGGAIAAWLLEGSFLLVGFWVLLTALFGCTSLVLLALALLGEYASRAYHRVRKSPLFLVKEKCLTGWSESGETTVRAA